MLLREYIEWFWMIYLYISTLQNNKNVHFVVAKLTNYRDTKACLDMEHTNIGHLYANNNPISRYAGIVALSFGDELLRPSS